MEQNKERALEAARVYIDRRDRKARPTGTFDKAGRWEPSETEHLDCCDEIRRPTRAFPYSRLLHCRTAKHVAALFGVTRAELLEQVPIAMAARIAK